MFGQYDRIGWISYIPNIPISTYIHSFGAFTRDGGDEILIHDWHPISTSTTVLSYKGLFVLPNELIISCLTLQPIQKGSPAERAVIT